ncbi:MAG: RNA methyltransferase [Desulfatitalea sp.]|nr:RNA methyltransferase [Desulfatitalea sp.]
MDKNGETIAAAVTALDLHDIARAAKTYGVDTFYVVTPLTDQQDLVRRIIGHWASGAGARYNPDRQAALALIRLMPTLAAVLDDMAEKHGHGPQTVATSAQMADGNLTFAGLRDLARQARPLLLLFGTAWGLAPEMLTQADHRLAPIAGHGDYNHLSVRSAVSIILDRMLG